MNPDRHRPLPGSSAYYLIRFAPRPRREALLALHEIVHSISSVYRETEDPGVASTKLAWWRNEINQAASGSGQHPAVQRLSSQLDNAIGHPCWPALLTCVAATEADAQQSRYLDDVALLRQVELSASGIASASVSILAPGDTKWVMPTQSTLTATGLVQILRNLGRDTRRGCLYVPINDLQQFDVKAHEILQIKPGLQKETRFINLMRHQAQRARQHMSQARSNLDAQPRAMRRFNAGLLAHNNELLDALEATQFEVLSQHVSLTPLRKLWLAWTAR